VARFDIARALATARRAGVDAEAWSELVEILWPELLDLTRRSRLMGPLRRSDDHVRNVATRVLEKLSADDFRRLSHFQAWSEARPGKTFSDWLRIVNANVVRDYVRSALGETGEIDSAPRGRKRILNEFAEHLPQEMASRPPITLLQTARQLLEYAEGRLPPEQFVALKAWLEGASFEEIAEERSVEVELARKTLRAALASLRRHFAATG
jgi:DNA-directed RNA polymerase specialized sigma24 family protein